jgi:hypothetical protein
MPPSLLSFLPSFLPFHNPVHGQGEEGIGCGWLVAFQISTKGQKANVKVEEGPHHRPFGIFKKGLVVEEGRRG